MSQTANIKSDPTCNRESSDHQKADFDSIDLEIISLETEHQGIKRSGNCGGDGGPNAANLDQRSMESADAIVAVYSIVDRNSFHLVRCMLVTCLNLVPLVRQKVTKS